MALYLKQTTATSVGVGPFVSSGDGYTVQASLTINQDAIRLSYNGKARVAPSTTAGATYDTMGWYNLHLSTTDTGTLGQLSVAVSTAGALPAWADFMVLPANVFDALVSGTDYLQADMREANVAVTAGTVSDKTGYSLAAGQVVTAGTVSDKTGYALADGAITAAKVATGALTSDGFAANAILSQPVASVAGAVGSVTGAVGSVTAAVTAGTIQTGAITSAGFAANAITSSAIATDAIDDDALSADAIVAIQSGLSTLTAAQVESQLAGSHGTGSWEGGGAAPTAAAVADAVWDEARADHATAGTFGEGAASVQGSVTGSVASVTAATTVGTLQSGVITAASISTGAFTSAGFAANALLSQTVAPTTAGTVSDKTGYSLAAGQIVTAGTLAAGSLTAAVVSTGAFTSDGFAANALLSQTVAATTVGTINAGAITATAIADNAIDAGAIADDAITAAKIAAGALTSEGFAANAILAQTVAPTTLGTLESTAGNVIADYTLRRSLASAEASANGDTLAFRSPIGALAKLVNKISISGSSLTIYKSDDSTSLGTQTLTSSSGASPITAADTV